MIRQHLPTFAAGWHRFNSLAEKLNPLGNDHPGSLWRISHPWLWESLRTKQRSLLLILALAHSQKLDCVRLVSNLAEEHGGRYGRRLRRLARRLADGMSVVEAVEQTPDVLSDSTVLAIRFGTQSGSLDAVYRELLEDYNLPSHDAGLPRVSYAYMGLVLMLFLSILTFISVKIVPVFVVIGEEFGMEPSKGLASFEIMARGLTSALGWIFIAAAVIWASISAGWIQRLLRRTIASRYIRTVARHRSAEVLRLLAIAQDLGRPISGSLSTLARYHYDHTIRTQLLYARNEVEQGAEAWTSLAGAGLLSSRESQSLALSTSSPTRGWTMRRIARLREQQTASRGHLILELMNPLMVLILAAIVLWCGWAMMDSLTSTVIRMS